MLEGKYFCLLDKAFSFVVVFIKHSTECERRVPITTVRTRFTKIVAYLIEDMRQQAYRERYLKNLETGV